MSAARLKPDAKSSPAFATIQTNNGGNKRFVAATSENFVTPEATFFRHRSKSEAALALFSSFSNRPTASGKLTPFFRSKFNDAATREMLASLNAGNRQRNFSRNTGRKIIASPNKNKEANATGKIQIRSKIASADSVILGRCIYQPPYMPSMDGPMMRSQRNENRVEIKKATNKTMRG